jgi:hypothetical protein
MHRIESIAEDFSQRLERLSGDECRAIATAACELALSRNPVDDPVVISARLALQSGRSPTDAERTQLENLLNRLDVAYFELQATAEERQDGSSAWEAAFKRARAVASLFYALDDDPLTAAAEAVYEAAAALDDPSEVLDAVEPIHHI